MDDIQTRVEDHCGMIVLNRPQAINALSLDMIDTLSDVLGQWSRDDRVSEVVIAGAGRGFCAGADVRQMREMILHGSGDPVGFLAREYALNSLIAHYPKP